MKRITLLVCVVLLGMLVFTACGKKPKTNAEAIAEGTYDWDLARDTCVKDIAAALKVVVAGDTNTYTATRTEWLSRIKPEAQGSMFPNTSPPQGCSSAVTYRGYSGPDYNSENTEYILYDARCLNNQTLESIDYVVEIELERGNDGYIIAGFSKEVVR